jgi:hypothetical protein
MLKAKFGQGELAHRALKMFYPLTSKLDTPAQLAKHERRRRVLRRVAEAGAVSSSSSSSPSSYSQPQVEVPTSMPSGKHHSISTIRNNPIDIFSFLRENNGDPAVKVKCIVALSITLLTALVRTSSLS